MDLIYINLLELNSYYKISNIIVLWRPKIIFPLQKLNYVQYVKNFMEIKFLNFCVQNAISIIK